MIVLNVSDKEETKSKRLHKILQTTILKRLYIKYQQIQESQSSVVISQLTEAITAISLFIEDVNGAKTQDSLTKSKEKEESKWKKLPELSQKVILGMQARYADDMDKDRTDDIVIPDRPSEIMNDVVRCSTGARAQQFLNHLLMVNHNCIMNLSMGMCTALKNVLLMSQPSPNKVYCFSLYFTPPFHMDEDAGAELHLQLEEQGKNSRLLADNLDLVMNQKIHYPESYSGLRHVTKNFSCPTHDLAGERSIIAQEMRNVVEHVAKFETDYTFNFK